ncbi:MAG: alpha/beta hydrolase [Shimia thalassica]|uniref:alpha/beta hydrolase n=1 Tax=Shimia thalassica TaxID=1715693 RepID=UPI00329A2856
MGWRKSLLNSTLRLMEKPHLAHVKNPAFLRTSADWKAALWFRPPSGTEFHQQTLSTDACTLNITVSRSPSIRAGRVVLFAHGGGYVFGSPRTHRALVAQLCHRLECEGWIPDYRLAPEHPFPAALDDLRATYDHLVESGTSPKDIILAGDSAGGGLTLALLLSLREDSAPLPAAVVAFSPLTDMTFSGASFSENRRSDVLLPAHRAKDAAEMYLKDCDPKNPKVSPLFGDFTGVPPIYLAAGTTEILRDDTLRLVEALKQQNVETTLELQDDLPHVWPLFHGYLPEADQTLDRIAVWAKPLLSSEDES